jgi:hypothetical protein
MIRLIWIKFLFIIYLKILVRVKKWTYTFLTAFLILAGCSEKEGRIIPKKKLVEMMADLYTCDALASNNYLCTQLGGIDSTIIYSTLKTKYKYTKKDLDYTLRYYSTKPKKLTLIYDQVFAELSKRADDYRNVTNNFSYQNMKTVWYNKTPVLINADTTSYLAGYDVALDLTGTYIISALIKMTMEDKSKNPFLTAYFYNPEKDIKEERIYFKKTPIFKSEYSREYQIIEKNDNPKLTHLFIIIPDQENRDSVFYKYLSVSNLTVSQYVNKSDTANLK